MELQFDWEYLKTLPGLFLAAELAVGICVLICLILATVTPPLCELVWFTAIVSMLDTVIWMFLCVLHLTDTHLMQQWLVVIGLVRTATWAVFFFWSGVMSSLVAAGFRYFVLFSHNLTSSYGFTAFFCLLGTVIFLTNFGFCLKEYRDRKQEAAERLNMAELNKKLPDTNEKTQEETKGLNQLA